MNGSDLKCFLLFSCIQVAMEHVGEESAPWLDVCGLPVSVVCVSTITLAVRACRGLMKSLHLG